MTENMIDVETFLFGGVCGDPYNTVNLDGDHSVSYRHTPENFKDFETFKGAVEFVLDEYVWDLENRTTVERATVESRHYQSFALPGDDVLKTWYVLEMERASA